MLTARVEVVLTHHTHVSEQVKLSSATLKSQQLVYILLLLPILL